MDEILDLIAAVDASLAESLGDAVALNPYGVALRYPGDFPEMTPGDAEKALSLAAKVRQTIMAILSDYLKK